MGRVDAMRQAPRCAAKTRKGTACKAPAIRGKKRCRRHGGAPGSGGQAGNRNALKHGAYTAREVAVRNKLRDLYREMKGDLREYEDR